MKRIYLDSNILIAYYAGDKAEKTKKEATLKALSIFANSANNVRLYTSMWAIAEMANILISNKKIAPEVVHEIENHFTNERRLQGAKVELIQVSPKTDYDFQEFFYHIRQGILKYHSGVGDIIHSVIMKNNELKLILTFDDKDDFKQIPDLTVMRPETVKMKS